MKQKKMGKLLWIFQELTQKLVENSSKLFSRAGLHWCVTENALLLMSLLSFQGSRSGHF